MGIRATVTGSAQGSLPAGGLACLTATGGEGGGCEEELL